VSTYCPLCKGDGRSRVVETREKPSRIVWRGKRQHSKSVVRVRECLSCRLRWKTLEVPYEATLNRRRPGPWTAKKPEENADGDVPHS